MVEQDAVTGKETIALTIVHGNPVSVDFRHAIGTARIEWGGFSLRDLLRLAIHLRTARLIELCLDSCLADSLQNPQCAKPRHVPSVFGDVKTDAHMALCCEMIDFIGLDAVEQFDKTRRVSGIAIV